MSLYMLFLLYVSRVFPALTHHYAFGLAGAFPSREQADLRQMAYFKTDYSLYLHIASLLVSGLLIIST